MNSKATALDSVRDKIIRDPDLILGDRDLMRALIAANERQMGSNIVDLRGIAMERLEERLDRLEDTHRSVIAAAYENLSGVNQIQRAVLALLEPLDFPGFMKALSGEVSEILRVDRLRLVLESSARDETAHAALKKLGDAITLAEPGTVNAYITGGRNIPVRAVTLRQVSEASQSFFGEAADWIHSEALLRLDLGPKRLPGLLLLGSEDPHQFRPNQGTDTLAFFAAVFERTMRRFLR